MIYYIGQGFAFLTAVLTFFSYQVKKHNTLLAMQTMAVVCSTLGYLILGVYTGFATNAICLVRNIVFYFNGKKEHPQKFWAYIFAVLVGAGGFFAWQGAKSLLMIIALVINTLALSVDNVQFLRKSILLTSSMLGAYNIICGVYGGILNEAIAITSSVIGLIRYRNNCKS